MPFLDTTQYIGYVGFKIILCILILNEMLKHHLKH